MSVFQFINLRGSSPKLLMLTSTFGTMVHLIGRGKKRAWELEQELEWTKVLSKLAKRELKKKENAQKRVRFSSKLDSPQPSNSNPTISIAFGAFTTQVDPSSFHSASPELVARFGSNSSHATPNFAHHVLGKRDDQGRPIDHASVGSDQLPQKADFQARKERQVSNSNPKPLPCSRCLRLGHPRWACRSKIT